VNPYAVETLREAGIDWRGRQPRGIDDLAPGTWDIVITVCDKGARSVPHLSGPAGAGALGYGRSRERGG
jgi:protein-tyrosine-phosphatase